MCMNQSPVVIEPRNAMRRVFLIARQAERVHSGSDVFGRPVFGLENYNAPVSARGIPDQINSIFVVS